MTRDRARDDTARSADTWIRDVAEAYPTEDGSLACRVLRTWLHALRDWLPPDEGACFADRLSVLVRGIYYETGTPRRVADEDDRAGHVECFARDADVSPEDVPKAAAAVVSALAHHIGASHLDVTLDRLSEPVRDLLTGAGDVD